MRVISTITGLFALFAVTVVMFMVSPDAVAAKKVNVCHKGQTIRISNNALDAHLGHGDFEGDCEDVPLSEWLNFRCDSPSGAGFTVTNYSGSDGLAQELTTIGTSVTDCAAAQKLAQGALCQIRESFGTPDAQVYVFNCPTVAVP